MRARCREFGWLSLVEDAIAAALLQRHSAATLGRRILLLVCLDLV